MAIGTGKIIIADEDALSDNERKRLEENGFFIIRKKFGRNIEVQTFPPVGLLREFPNA